METHLDPAQIQAVKKSGTIIVAPAAVQASLSEARILKNGERTEVLGIGIEAIPMYNLQRGPEEGKLFHDKGRGNGYLLTLGAERVYISGDTECVPRNGSSAQYRPCFRVYESAVYYAAFGSSCLR